MNRSCGVMLACLALGSPLSAQAVGDISGVVRDSATGDLLRRVFLRADSGIVGVLTDRAGRYQLRGLTAGLHRVSASLAGYEPVVRESVLVRAGATTTLDILLRPPAFTLAPVTVATERDAALDPRTPSTTQTLAGEELRRLPVSSVDEGIALSAGSVGESYRGGRVGEQSYIIDGLGVKNQLDASSGGLGLRLPPDIVQEASLTTDAFSARYGQAMSGLVSLVTKDGGERWRARGAYETDRPLPQGWDFGLDRFSVEADGPISKLRLVAALDATGRVEADPVDAPAPSDPRDPRSASPWLLPHDGGETYDGALKLTLPLGQRDVLRGFALRSIEQRLLYDPAYKYAEALAPASRLTGNLESLDWRRTADTATHRPLDLDIHLGAFSRDFVRGTLDRPAASRFGGFTDGAFHFVGESVARAQDTVTASGALPDFGRPDYSDQTPWGVPAFFLAQGSSGEISWYNFRDLRGQLDARVGLSPVTDLYIGGLVAAQRVRTFSRVLAYLPVGDSVPPTAASSLSPLSAAAYFETQYHLNDLAVTAGVRLDQFDTRSQTGTGIGGARRTFSPRLAVSTVVHGATIVASWGRFSQAPDFQYLVDAAFDDTLRTGRFRRGNPDLGFEEATQYAFSVRARPSPRTNVRVNVYQRRLEGLVASVPLGANPDSSVFGNADFGTVKGVELMLEREMRDWWGARVSYTLQSATATAANAFQFAQRVGIDTFTRDTLASAPVEFPLDFDRRHGLTVILQAHVPERMHGAGWLVSGVEGGLVVRYDSGLPYSRTNAAGDSLLGLPNEERLPVQSTVALLLRRPFSIRGQRGAIYLDVRNLLGRRNIVAVRRDNGDPAPSTTTLQAMAQAAYNAHPEAIPYESPRYRSAADLNQDGYISGLTELMPLYLAAARDFTQPLFVYGAPRLVRLGFEITF